MGQVSINFLQKGPRLNVSGRLKCSFHRGEAEKGTRGGDRRRSRGGGAGTGCDSFFGPSAHQIVWCGQRMHMAPNLCENCLQTKEGVTPVMAQ